MTVELSKTEKVEYAKRVLNQYKSNAYLADLDFTPLLDADGTISNLNAFVEVKNKTRNPFSCDTPVEKFAALAPRAVTAILEGIHQMESSYEEKKIVFNCYIENIEGANEPVDDTLVQFAEAYDDSYVQPPSSRPNADTAL